MLDESPYGRHSGHFTKRKRTAKKAHPLIQKWVRVCETEQMLRQEIADRSGIDVAQIYAYEAAINIPKINDFEVLCITVGRKLVVSVGGVVQTLPEPDGKRHPLVIWLRQRRLACGLRQQDLAKWCGRHYTTINGWEGGRHMPRLDHFYRACVALGDSLELREDDFDVQAA